MFQGKISFFLSPTFCRPELATLFDNAYLLSCLLRQTKLPRHVHLPNLNR